MTILKKQTQALLITILSIIMAMTYYNIAQAKTVTNYTINNIHVYAKSTSSTSAKNKAIISGKQKAFTMLLKELVSSKDLKKLPKLSNSILSSYVSSYSVNSSNSTATSYVGVLTYNFNVKKVDNFLTSAKIKFLRMTTEPILIVPVIKFGSKYITGYGKTTPSLWQKAWQKTNSPNYSLLSFTYMNDSSVLSKSFDPALLMKGNRRTLLALRRHFGLVDIAVVYILPTSNALSGRVIYFPVHNKPVAVKLSINSQDYIASINKAKQLILACWKRYAYAVKKQEDSTLKIVSTIRQIKPWLRLKRYINTLGKNTQLISLQMGHMSLVTSYPAGGKYMAKILQKYGYHMIKKEAYWEISLIGQKPNKPKSKISSAPVKHMNVESSNLPMAK